MARSHVIVDAMVVIMSHAFPSKDAVTLSGTRPAATVHPRTAGPLNVANSIDGSDGSVTTLVASAVAVSGAPVHVLGYVAPLVHS